VQHFLAGGSRVKGDRIIVLVDVGDGKTAEYITAATKAGRSVSIEARGKFIEVSELTRFGETVRTNRFMPSRVVALIEDHRGDLAEGARDVD